MPDLTFWHRCPRNFQNEYDIGIASTYRSPRIKRWLIRLWNPSFGLGELPHQPPPEAAAVIRKLIQTVRGASKVEIE